MLCIIYSVSDIAFSWRHAFFVTYVDRRDKYNVCWFAEIGYKPAVDGFWYKLRNWCWSSE